MQPDDLTETRPFAESPEKDMLLSASDTQGTVNRDTCDRRVLKHKDVFAGCSWDVSPLGPFFLTCP